MGIENFLKRWTIRESDTTVIAVGDKLHIDRVGNSPKVKFRCESPNSGTATAIPWYLRRQKAAPTEAMSQWLLCPPEKGAQWRWQAAAVLVALLATMTTSDLIARIGFAIKDTGHLD